ncbi:MAG TPA: toprim domain-containing protein [Stellaceae bacterium]|nr:toprim domain-containing protein [Stellaceae bacterium]
MTPAERLTVALGGKWLGQYGLARCPCHDDRRPSLTLRDGEHRVLFHCFAGCAPVDIVAEARRRRLLTDQRQRSHLAPMPATHPPYTRAAALRTWFAANSVRGTLVENYLLHRGITVPPPSTLRFATLKHTPTGQRLPAMVAAVQGHDARIIAVHRTFLAVDGQAKAKIDPPRMALGALEDGAVRLAPACGHFVGICEGIETGLSATQLFHNFPVWCSLGAERMSRLWLPPEIQLIVIFADRDEAGARAAEKAKRAYEAAGRLVEIVWPKIGTDFNDDLRARATAA